METITTAELKALGDQLNCEQLLIKKFKAYAASAQDPQIRQVCEQTASQHKTHYDTLLSHLGGSC
ncbi:MAG: spore coat protein [Clostridia bacterium]|nr:spore coat protein [Clostridia bacterium]